MIYYDPSEGRVGTRLPYSAIEISHPLIGLEERTGADLMVTASPLLLTDCTRPPGSILWEKIVPSSMLIQRKTGLDLIASVPKLGDTLARMVAERDRVESDGRLPPQLWLLVIGFYESTIDGYVKLGDGSETDFRWAALVGAMDAWQLRGGMLHLHWTHWEPMVTDWLRHWDEKLPSFIEEREKIIFSDYQHLTRYSDHRLSVLMGFPGMGIATASTLLTEFDSVQRIVEWMANDGKGVKGIGPKTIEKWRGVLLNG